MRWLGAASLLFSLGPIAIVVGLITAFSIGLPPPGSLIRTISLVAFGLFCVLAVALGVIASCKRFSLSAMAGIGLGVLELLALGVVLYFRPT